MYILIDYSESNQLTLHYVLDKIWANKVFKTPFPGGLIGAINQTFLQTKTTLANLKGVAVLVGKGGFTSTRLAVTIANTLSYACKIPVISVTSLNFNELTRLFSNLKTRKYILPVYSGKPRIGAKGRKI